MTEVYRKQDATTPWNMPHKTYWDITEGASVRRAQWLVDNRPDVTLDEMREEMALQPEELALLQLPSDHRKVMDLYLREE